MSWFISDKPSTLFIPLNSGLPKDPSVLAQMDQMRDMLLNHAIVGDLIDMKAAHPTGDIYYSLADSELVITKKNGMCHYYFTNTIIGYINYKMDHAIYSIGYKIIV